MGLSALQKLRFEFDMRRRYVAIRTRGQTVATDVLWARSFLARGRGLLGTHGLTPGRDGCLLDPCRRIHCHGMKYPIDTIHLSREFYIVGLERVDIGKTGARFKGSRCVLELASGEIERCGLMAGDMLAIDPSRVG